MKKSIAILCLLSACGKEVPPPNTTIINKYETPHEELKPTCDDILMSTYFDLKMKTHLVTAEINRLEEKNSYLKNDADVLIKLKSDLDEAIGLFETFKTDCTGIIKNQLQPIVLKDIVLFSRKVTTHATQVVGKVKGKS